MKVAYITLLMFVKKLRSKKTHHLVNGRFKIGDPVLHYRRKHINHYHCYMTINLSAITINA